MYPVLDGSHHFTQSYNYKRSQKAKVSMLWEDLNKKGVKVGFMNIPTTSPAPEVNGFFVGGGGGGVSKTSGVPSSLCDSEETRLTLEENNYVADLRLGGDKISTLTEMFDRLDDIIRMRQKTFLTLCEKQKPDFGFLCFRVTTTVQYVCMSEIEALLAAQDLAELNISSEIKEADLNDAQRRIVSHFALLDDLIREVFEKLNPQEHLFCADHGASGYKYNVNVNAFLQETGFQVVTPAATLERKWKTFRTWRFLRGRAPGFLKSKMGSIQKKLKPINFCAKSTRAFGHWYVQGIYINDKERFGGPVKPGVELDALVDQICKEFNSNSIARQYKMSARPFRRDYLDSPWSNEFVDILIDKPDEMFFGRDQSFVEPNKNYGPLSENIEGLSDMNSGQKSRFPLFIMSSGLADLVKDDDEKNICLVHKVITRCFS